MHDIEEQFPVEELSTRELLSLHVARGTVLRGVVPVRNEALRDDTK